MTFPWLILICYWGGKYRQPMFFIIPPRPPTHIHFNFFNKFKYPTYMLFADLFFRGKEGTKKETRKVSVSSRCPQLHFHTNLFHATSFHLFFVHFPTTSPYFAQIRMLFTFFTSLKIKNFPGERVKWIDATEKKLPEAAFIQRRLIYLILIYWWGSISLL